MEFDKLVSPEANPLSRNYFGEFIQNKFMDDSGEIVFEPGDFSDPSVRLFLRFVLGGDDVLPIMFGKRKELLLRNLVNIHNSIIVADQFDGLSIVREFGDLRTQGNLRLNEGFIDTVDTVSYWGDKHNLVSYSGYALYDRENITDEANFQEDFGEVILRFNEFIKFVRWFNENEGAFFARSSTEVSQITTKLEFLLGTTDWHRGMKKVASAFRDFYSDKNVFDEELLFRHTMELLNKFAQTANPDLPKDASALLRTQQIVVIV